MSAQSQMEWALGLYAYPESRPTPQVFAEFYSIVAKALGSVGTPPTHIAADGKGYSGKMVKFGGKESRRLVDSGFADISILSLSVSLPGSKAPAFDRLVYATLGWLPNELLLCLAVNDGVIQFLGVEFDNVLSKLLAWRSWAFGFAFRDEVVRQPDFHVLSADNGKLSKEERQALARWYAARAEERQVKLRSVYPVNILNKQQQSQRIGDRTLRDLIRGKPSTKVDEVGGLVIWRVPESEVESLRTALGAKGVLIAVGRDPSLPSVCPA